MARQTSKGTCIFCHGELSKSAMTRHLETCEQRAITEAKAGSRQKAQQTRKLHLVVEGRDLLHHAALAGWGNSSTTHFGMMFILASCYLRCGYIRQCLLIQMVLVRMYRGARTRTKSANSMSMTVEAKRERSITIKTSTSSTRLSTMLRKPAVVMVETSLAVALVVWLRAANNPPMMKITSRPTPVIGMVLRATMAAPDPEWLVTAVMCVTGRA